MSDTEAVLYLVKALFLLQIRGLREIFRVDGGVEQAQCQIEPETVVCIMQIHV